MTKSRGYKMVIHNVLQKSQATITNWIQTKNTVWATTSVEPYPEDESRYHLHIFIAFKTQVHKTSILKELQRMTTKVGFCAPRPEGEERDWNRVDVKPMIVKDLKQTFDACNDYLQGATKDKPVGEVCVFVKKPCGRRVRLNRESRKYEEFCFYCTQADCQGCCKGCSICTPTTGHDELIRRNIIINSENAIKKSLKENRKKVITPADNPFDYPKIEYL